VFFLIYICFCNQQNFNTMKKILLFICILFSITVFSQKGIPNVKLKDLEGKTIDIGEFNKSDKPIIISFWATWCGPCLKELGAIADDYAQWQKETGVELIAVSIDDAKTIKKVKPLVAGKGWNYKVLLDENGALRRAMNVVNVPHTFIVYKGRLVSEHTSYVPGVEKKLFKQIKELIK